MNTANGRGQCEKQSVERGDKADLDKRPDSIMSAVLTHSEFKAKQKARDGDWHKYTEVQEVCDRSLLSLYGHQQLTAGTCLCRSSKLLVKE